MIRKRINNTRVVNIITMILFVAVIIVNLGFSFAWFTASKSATVEDPTLKFGTIQIETNNDTYFNNASSTYYNSIQSGSNLLSNDIKLNLKSGSEKCYVRARMDFTATNPTSEDEKILKYLKYKDYTLASSGDYKWSSKIGDYWYLLNAFGMPLEVTNTTTGYYTFLTKEQTKLDMTFDASLVSANGIKMKVTLEAIQVDNINSIGLPSTLENIESALNDVNNINTPTDNFSVTFVDLDGTTTTVNANYKGSLTVPTSMQAYIQTGFALWDGGESVISGTSNSHSYIEDVILYNITENLTLYANSKNFAFTVNYYNGNELLQSNNIKYNNISEYFGSTPVKESTAQYKYNFIGWSETNSNGAQIVTDFTVKSSKNYYAQYEAETRKYLVTFRNYDGEILQQTEIPYNTTPSYVAKTPTKNSDSNYSYTFKGWSPALSAVTSDQNYVATYNKTALPTQKYLVKWKNYDGSVLKTEELEYGATPSYTGSTPTRMQDAQYTYTFTGWSPEISVVTSEQNYVAQYSSQLRSYTINFVNYDDSQLVSPLTLTYGSAITYNGATPTKPSDENNVYVFAGWSLNEVLIDLSIQTVTGNATYKAVFNTLVPLTLPSTWKTDINWTNLGLTEVTDLTSIRFEKTAPSGYAKTSETINNIEIWQNSTTNTKLAFVYASKIMAPASCNQLFYSLTNITELLFNNFNTNFVTDMSYMFVACVGLTNLDLSGFDTSNVTTMTYMFTSCTNLNSLDLNNFNTDNVTDMSAMFTSCSGLNSLNVCSFNTRSVTNMSNMFWGCSSLTSLDLSSFDTRNVRDMNYMFYNCSGLTSLDLSSFDTRLVTDMSNMFQYCSALTILNLSNFNTSSVTDMSNMFYGCSGLTSLDLSSFNTSSVTNMSQMFNDCNVLTGLDLSSFDTSKVTNMSNMFGYCNIITKIYASSSFVTTKVSNSTDMFLGCAKLVGGNGTPFSSSYIDKTYARIDEEGTPGYFTEKVAAETYTTFPTTWKTDINWANLGLNDASDLTSIRFENIVPLGYELTTEKLGDIFIAKSSSDSSKIAFVYPGTIMAPESCHSLFRELTNLKNIVFNNFNTSKVTDMSFMFTGSGLTGELDLKIFNTINVTAMTYMFHSCSGLTTLDLSNFNTNKVTDTQGMFYNCSSLTSINLTSFDTSSVTNMNRMFYSCSSLTSLDVSNFDTSKVTNMSNMFLYCTELTSLNLTSFDTSSVTDMSDMFYGCSNLSTIYVSGNFVTTNVTSSDNMFSNCTKLVGGNGTTFNSSYTDKTYARLDLESTPGYFTSKPLTTFVDFSFEGLPTRFSGLNIWTDGSNYYYSDDKIHYILDKSTSTWKIKSWTDNRGRMPSFTGEHIWTDGDNYYLEDFGILNKSTSTWETKTWSGLTSFSGINIWTDGSNYYYSDGSKQYILDKSTSIWSQKTWNGLTSFYGYEVWTDGNNIYYSHMSNQYILNKSTSTWETKTWSGVTFIYGYSIWTDGSNYYYSPGSSHYILNKSTSTWEEKTWNGFTAFEGSFVWTDGSDIYYSSSSSHYILNKSTSTWEVKSWNGLNELNYDTVTVWTDGSNYYHSYNSSQYVLNKSTSTWETKTWNGLTDFYGSDVWTDGSNIYYSYLSKQYILDKSTSTWETKTWSGLTDFYGRYVWTDGSNYYYSDGSKQYILNKETSTWEAKTWIGLTSFSGANVWTDGNNYYYSYNSNQYILNKSTSTWSTKTWIGLTSFIGDCVWTDGSNYYYSYYSDQYILNKATEIWEKKTWIGLTSFIGGRYVWTDGNNFYYKSGIKII